MHNSIIAPRSISHLLLTLAVLVAQLGLGSAGVFAQSGADINRAYDGLVWSPDGLGSNCIDLSFIGRNNTESVFRYFVQNGFTPEQSAGFVGNFLVETAGTMDPKIKQGGGTITDPEDQSGRPGRGLAQWETPGRWDRLLEYAEALDRDPLALDLQLDFVMFELTGEPPAEGVSGGYESRAYEEIQNSNTVEDAAVAVARFYERNADSIAYGKGELSYEAAFTERIAASEEVYADLAGSGSTSSGTSFNCGPNGEGINFDIVEGDTADIPCQGRIVDEYIADGYRDGKRHIIRICVIELSNGSAGPHVNSQISGAMYQMFQTAWGSGVRMNGGGFRTMEGQIDARIRNGCPDIYNAPASSCNIPTARPGYSNHQMGFAIDFYNVSNVSSVTVEGMTYDTYRTHPGNATWEWLWDNASSYGLEQLYSEAWHWSIDGR